MACFIALVYNWWNLFARLAEPSKHLEAVTSRPLLLLSAIAERSRHARQTTLRMVSSMALCMNRVHTCQRAVPCVDTLGATNQKLAAF